MNALLSPILAAVDIPGAADIGSKAGDVAGKGAEAVGSQLAGFVGNPAVLAAGIGLVIITVLLIVMLKKIIINSVLGIIAWVVLTFVLHIEMPFFPSLVLSIVFGLAGIGSILVLKFLGVSLA
ncbi:MAG: hypothetical protein NT067_03180 [Candidatus Diapherotrites archaeon]|nr:hypothetical protein [Candidatus Diapherotrites archaeon]